jgi:transcriptional regulator with XRE-family HTH domain
LFIVTAVATKPSWLEQRESFHALTSVNPISVLERWSNGDQLKDIAADYGVTLSAVSRWLRRNANTEDIELARELHFETKLDTGLEKIELAEDDVNLARAREAYLRRLEWRAATECKRWQQKPNTAVQINGSGEMQVQIVSYASNNAVQQPVATSNDSQQDS